MSLCVEKHQDTGVVLNYFKIARINANTILGDTAVVLVGYVSKAVRDENPTFYVSVNKYDWTAEELPLLPEDNILVKCYDKLKTLPDWEFAEDC